MRNRNINDIIFTCIFVHFLSCNNVPKEKNEEAKPILQTEKIVELKYAAAGGDLGYRLLFLIRPDSTIYLLENDMDTQKRKTFRKATDASFWKSLTNDVDLDMMAKIKSGESRQPYDGTDSRLEITTNQRSIAFTNGEADSSHYPSVQKMMHQINDTLINYYTH